MARERLFWLWSRILPELDLFETTKQAEQCRRRAGFWHRFFSAICVCGFMPACLWVCHSFNITMGKWVFCLVLLLVMSLPCTSVWLTRSRVRRNLRKELVKIGVPICIHCAYDLRGQIEPRCPECGRPFDFADFHNAKPPSTRDQSSILGMR